VKAGTTQNYVEEVEAGRSVPSPQVMEELASALGLGIHSLVGPAEK
jgi:hypothetical protein